MIQINQSDAFAEPSECATLLVKLFSLKDLWEDRRGPRTPNYRNGHWYTLGASIYMDWPEGPRNEDSLPAFAQKTDYFNSVLKVHFASFYKSFAQRLGLEFFGHEYDVQYLGNTYDLAPLPAFHIFPPEETFISPFGKVHRDLQWQQLIALPGFRFDPEKIHDSHFTFTLPLALPYQGGGMLMPGETDKLDRFFMYEEGNLYVHSGQFPHMVLPLKAPVTMLDWRITFQGHGFIDDKTIYLYW